MSPLGTFQGTDQQFTFMCNMPRLIVCVAVCGVCVCVCVCVFRLGCGKHAKVIMGWPGFSNATIEKKNSKDVLTVLGRAGTHLWALLDFSV